MASAWQRSVGSWGDNGSMLEEEVSLRKTIRTSHHTYINQPTQTYSNRKRKFRMSNDQYNLRRLVCVLHFKWPSELPATPTSIFNFYLHCLVCIPSYSNRNWKSQMPTFGPQQTYQLYGWIIALFRWHPFVVDLSNSTKISTNYETTMLSGSFCFTVSMSPTCLLSVTSALLFWQHWMLSHLVRGKGKREGQDSKYEFKTNLITILSCFIFAM